MKVFELKELSMKFERHMISEIVDFEVLMVDYMSSLLLGDLLYSILENRDHRPLC